MVPHDISHLSQDVGDAVAGYVCEQICYDNSRRFKSLTSSQTSQASQERNRNQTFRGASYQLQSKAEEGTGQHLHSATVFKMLTCGPNIDPSL